MLVYALGHSKAWHLVYRCKHRALHCGVTAASAALVIETERQVLAGGGAKSKSQDFSCRLDWEVQKGSYPLHLHTSCLDAALGQALFGDDATDMIREHEGGLQDGEGLRVWAGGRLVDSDIQGTAVILHSCHLHVLQKACKLDHSPAESGHIRLYQAHLVNIHSQEALNHAAVLGDDCACDQVAVISIASSSKIDSSLRMQLPETRSR